MSSRVLRRCRRGVAAAVLPALLVGAAACAEDDTEGVNALCDARNDLEDSLGEVADGRDVGDALDDALAALDDLRAAAGDELDAEMDAVAEAVGRLDDAVTAADGQSLGERVDVLGNAVSDVGSSLDALFDAAGEGC